MRIQRPTPVQSILNARPSPTGSIFRIERGIMRNIWYPTKKAEFMTDTRMKQLGLTKNDVGERDPMFGMQLELEEELVDDAVEAVAGLPRGAIPLAAAAGQPALESPSPAPAVEIEHVAVSGPMDMFRKESTHCLLRPGDT